MEAFNVSSTKLCEDIFERLPKSLQEGAKSKGAFTVVNEVLHDLPVSEELITIMDNRNYRGFLALVEGTFRKKGKNGSAASFDTLVEQLHPSDSNDAKDRVSDYDSKASGVMSKKDRVSGYDSKASGVASKVEIILRLVESLNAGHFSNIYNNAEGRAGAIVNLAIEEYELLIRRGIIVD